MDIPLTPALHSRNGLLFSDSHIINGYVQGKFTSKRPGLKFLAQLPVGIGQGVFTLSGVTYAIVADVIYELSGGGAIYPIPGITTAGLPYHFALNPPYTTAAYAVIKSTAGMWVLSAGVLTKVTDANYPPLTVPGLAYLDGAYYVKTPEGKIFGSGLQAPTVWPALNFISTTDFTGQQVALAKNSSYVVSFAQYSITAYYDAALPPPASPLAAAMNMLIPLGCATASSIAEIGGALVFMAQTGAGRSIQLLDKMSLSLLSTPDVDSILNKDSLVGASACSVTVAGRLFYLLSLPATNITLAYCLNEPHWVFWAGLGGGVPLGAVMAYDEVSGLITVAAAAHGLTTGDTVTVSGATDPRFNKQYPLTVVDANSFTLPAGFPIALVNEAGAMLVNEVGAVLIGPGPYPISGTIAGATFYSVAGLAALAVAASDGGATLLDTADGRVYELSVTSYRDSDSPIDFRVITPLTHSATATLHRVSGVEVQADTEAASGLLRYTDDDYHTWSQYRTINLGTRRSRIARLGSTRGRGFEFRYTGDTALRVEKLVVDIT